MGKLRSTWRFIRHYKYGISIILFFLIVGLLDTNSFWNRYKQKQEINSLRAEIRKYKDMYKLDSTKLRELEVNPEAIEKIARERYFMKAVNEDVFIFEEK
ncbi:MAG: septum formation initiator family protein [Bacteroidaceae bacterium]